MADFDPYRKWLGIPPHEQPPNFYRLLGLSPFESDKDVVANAADRQMAHLRTFQGGKNSAISQKILNELAAARICLMDPKKRAEYDARLRAEIGAQNSPATPVEKSSAITALPPVNVSPQVFQGRERPGSQFATVHENAPVVPYHLPRRRKSRWQGPLVTLIVSGVGLLLAAWFIYIAVERKLFEPNAQKELVKRPPAIPEKISEKPPKKNPLPPAPSPPSKEVRPSAAKAPADNAEENEKIGKRQCFMKGNWREGLPKLAASASDELKNLAQKELAAPEGKADRLAVADGWWAVSEKYAPPASGQIRRHAVEWYKKVVGNLEDSERDRAEWRISQETPTPRGEQPPVNPDELE
jgi:hypothetical protein